MTPMLSEAEAEVVIVPLTEAPAVGAVIDTVGGVESGGTLFTVKLTTADVV